MSNYAIEINGLGKKYHVAALRNESDTLISVLGSAIKAPARRAFNLLRGNATAAAELNEDFWALDNVTFNVRHGEVIGVIGHNGAGKSTLLKILSRITLPSKGYVRVNGRVGSLLEVGTGFHAELTGRENVFLNGSILGMSHTEIRRKFDEIVEFAGVGRFIDTPVKHYSSGMSVRLGFAVAAHLEPEILIVDEVLSVGDADFQRKSIGKMSDVARSGRTVLFVSHNMNSVEMLCDRAVLLDHGQVTHDGNTYEVISAYLSRHFQRRYDDFANAERSGNQLLKIIGFQLEDEHRNRIEHIETGQSPIFAFCYRNLGLRKEDRISLGFSFQTDREIAVFSYYSHFSGKTYSHLPEEGWIRCRLPNLSLVPGDYLLGCRVIMNGDLTSGVEVDYPHLKVPVTIIGNDFYGTGQKIGLYGSLLVKGEWE